MKRRTKGRLGGGPAGATVAEYALALALVAGLCIAAVSVLGGMVRAHHAAVTGHLQGSP